MWYRPIPRWESDCVSDRSSSLCCFIPAPPPLSVSVSICLSLRRFLAALGSGPFGKRSQGCRSDQFRHTSLHSWTDREMRRGGIDDVVEGVAQLHLWIYLLSLQHSSFTYGQTITRFKLNFIQSVVSRGSLPNSVWKLKKQTDRWPRYQI